MNTKWILAKCGDPLIEMIEIPAGKFLMGSSDRDSMAHDKEWRMPKLIIESVESCHDCLYVETCPDYGTKTCHLLPPAVCGKTVAFQDVTGYIDSIPQGCPLPEAPRDWDSAIKGLLQK